VHAVALTAREIADRFCWSAALEVEARDVRAASTSRLPTSILSSPPEISCQTVFFGSRASRL
jgi:hypothetical protein